MEEMAIGKVIDPLVGQLPCASPFLNRRLAADRAPGIGRRSSDLMPALAATSPADGALAAPDERGRLAIPAAGGRFQPGDDLIWRLGMLPAQGPPFQDALDRLGHIQPRPTQGRV